MTDADMAALTHRLADTAIEQSELYQAAKRDAEEAEAYAASLESDMNALADMLRKSKERNDALEAKLAKAVEALDEVDFKYDMQSKGSLYSDSWGGWESAFEEAAIAVRTTLAELKGGKDE